MLIAVGMYLPFDTVSAIFLGGVIKWVSDRIMAGRHDQRKLLVEQRGTLLASGLIAGEAIAGILLAGVFVAGVPALAHVSFLAAWGGWLSLAGFASIAYLLIVGPLHRNGTP